MRKLTLSLLPLALVAAPLALAGQNSPPPPAHLHPPSSVTKNKPKVDPATLHKFAAAVEAARTERTKYMMKLRSTKDAKKKAAIKKAAMKDIKAHIEKHMSLSEYEKTAKAVRGNPKVRQRLMKILRSDSQKSAPPHHGG